MAGQQESCALALYTGPNAGMPQPASEDARAYEAAQRDRRPRRPSPYAPRRIPFAFGQEVGRAREVTELGLGLASRYYFVLSGGRPLSVLDSLGRILPVPYCITAFGFAAAFATCATRGFSVTRDLALMLATRYEQYTEADVDMALDEIAAAIAHLSAAC